MDDTTPAIRIRDLVKRYAPAGKPASGAPAEGKLALGGVSFDVPRGQVFGLLGPNGAGKSTLINTLAGMVTKTSGTVEIWGHDIDHDRRNASASIGIVPQEVVFDPFFTPFEVLDIQAGLYGVPAARRRSRALLEAVHLADKATAYARSLSGGMRRRLLIAKAMVHSPPVLVLDEPTAGVDVELRRQLWDLVRELNHDGVTVVLTTHYLEEAEELCDRIAIINHGRLIANQPTREMLNLSREKVVVLTLDAPLAEPLQHALFRRSTLIGERQLEISYDKDLTSAGKVLAIVAGQGLGVVDVTTREADLEDVFVALTSTSAEPVDADPLV